MKKTLVVVAHPNLNQSIVNKRWIDELKLHSDRFTVHDLYGAYADRRIDVVQEQALIERHDSLVLQFPLYWFNCTPLLKQWLDEVFTYGWAYGSTGNKLKDKKMGLAVSAGISEEGLSDNGLLQTTLKDILLPFKLTAKYAKADYRPFFAFYSAGGEIPAVPERVEQSAQDYVDYLTQFQQSANAR